MSIGFEVKALDFSPIKGPEGNIEYLLHIVKLPEGQLEQEVPVDIDQIVKNAHKELSSK